MKLAVVTTSRADYGIYRPLLRALLADDGFEVGLVVSGTHLSGRHGRTVTEVEADGMPVVARVELDQTDDSSLAVARASGTAVAGFAEAFARHGPGAVVVLGDRSEMHAAAVAAVPMLLPVAHLHGGELTGGSFDELYRHSLTKLSHLHFVTTAAAGARVESMGEEPWRVHVTGALALDEQLAGRDVDLGTLRRRLGIDGSSPPVVVTFHPATLDRLPVTEQVGALVAAMEQLDGPFVITAPNADPGGEVVREALVGFAGRRPDAVYVESLGADAYRALLRAARLMIGNSSSGIIEAASHRLPVVNVGSRQDGRERGGNVVDAPCQADAIVAAARAVQEPEAVMRLSSTVNPYGDGHAVPRVLEGLRHGLAHPRLLRKRWYDRQDAARHET